MTLESWSYTMGFFIDTKMSDFLSFGDWYTKDIRKIWISIGEVLVQNGHQVPNLNVILTSITTNSWSAWKITNSFSLSSEYTNIESMELELMNMLNSLMWSHNYSSYM